VAAGTIDFADAIRVVRRRGKFMQQAVPVGQGAMAAILGLDDATVARICQDQAGDEVVSPANLNAPGQVVVAGHASAVDRVVGAAREQGARRAVRLAVSAPFHCSLMVPAAERLRPVLETLNWRNPRLPVFTNVDASPVREPAAAKDALFRQVAAPVRWRESVEALLQHGVDTFVELGPGRVLSGLVRRIDKSATLFSVEKPEDLDKVTAGLRG
jgi:[acyl-carrier-protein] S-malonyltransferase